MIRLIEFGFKISLNRVNLELYVKERKNHAGYTSKK